jgi:hypothetical protein
VFREHFVAHFVEHFVEKRSIGAARSTKAADKVSDKDAILG